MFVRPGIPEFMRDEVVPRADIITPNHFELDYLAGDDDEHPPRGAGRRRRRPRPRAARRARHQRAAQRPAPDTLDVVAVSDEGAWAVTTPLLPITPNGCGDVTAALYLAHLLTTGSPAIALMRTTSSVFAIFEATLAAGTREIALVAAQDSIAAPPSRFEARQLR